MDKEIVKNFIKVLQGYVDGKQIQIRGGKGWLDVVYDPWFDQDMESYRVKPEQKLIPFTIGDVEKFMGKPLMHKLFTGTFCMVQEVNPDNVWIGAGSKPHPYEFLLDNFTFLDGSPCGKIVEE